MTVWLPDRPSAPAVDRFLAYLSIYADMDFARRIEPDDHYQGGPIRGGLLRMTDDTVPGTEGIPADPEEGDIAPDEPGTFPEDVTEDEVKEPAPESDDETEDRPA